MGFKVWLEMSSLKDLLKGVPQSAKWHPEGAVWNHVRLVRQALPAAVSMFEKVRADKTSPFCRFTPVSKQDEDILRLSAWLHDIGKGSATAYTNPDKSRTPLSDFEGFGVEDLMSPDFGQGKWQSIGHETPRHYEPMMGKLGGPWQAMLAKLSPEDKDCLFFVIQKHMDLDSRTGIHKTLRNQMIGGDGKFLNDRKFKLWIIFKLMDVMGRGEGLDRAEGEAAIQMMIASCETKKAVPQPQKAPQTPQEMQKMLQAKGLPPEQIRQIIAKKFG